MRAVGLYRYLPIEDPESLVDVEIPEPEARGRDLKVRVKAVSVNPVDVNELQRIGEPEVDYILCFNSTEKHIQNMANAIKPQGKIGCIVGAKGNAPIPTSIFMRKSVAFCWELMFTRPDFQTPDMQAQHEILDEAAKLFEDGTLRHTMRENYGSLNAENLRKAHAAIESGRTIGKIVLSGIE